MARRKRGKSDTVGGKRTAEQMLVEINTKLGYEALNIASNPKYKIDRIPTGIPAVDYLLSGGFARGHYFEIFGDYSLGKTTICLRLVAQAQALDLDCFWLDPEKSFDSTWATHCGVDTEKLIVAQDLDFGDQYFDVAQALLRGGKFGVGICDSIAALYPQQEDSKPTSNLMPGTQARLMSKGLRKLNASKKGCVLGFINQTRDKLGVMFGDPTTTTGGRAMSFYAGTRIHLIRSEQIKESMQVYEDKSGEYRKKDVKVGERIIVKVEKDKTGAAQRNATTTLVFRGDIADFDLADQLFGLGMKSGVITKKGNSYSFSKTTILGRDKFKAAIRKRSVLREKLSAAIYASMPKEALATSTGEEVSTDAEVPRIHQGKKKITVRRKKERSQE